MVLTSRRSSSLGVIYLGLFLHATLANPVTVTPPINNIYQDTTASFIAAGTSPIDSIEWILDGQLLSQYPDLTFIHPTVVINTIRQLMFVNVSSAYNNSEVTCTATYVGNSDTISCSTSILQLQGPLGEVTGLMEQYNVMDSTVNISWIPPPALLVSPASTPERFYCVEVFDQSTSMSLIESRGCDQSSQNINRTDDPSFVLTDVTCGVNYTIRITPSNRIGSGQPSTVLFPGAVDIMDRTSLPIASGQFFTYVFPVSGMVCDCSAEFTNDNMQSTLPCEVNTPEPGFITVTTTGVPLNLDFYATITARNSRTLARDMMPLTTFDIVEVSLNSTNLGLDYFMEFADGSEALGALMILLFNETGQVDFSRSIYFVQGRMGAEADNQLSGISAGSYRIQVYDVEANGRITSSPAVDMKNIPIIFDESSVSIAIISLGDDINCTSSVTEDMGGVKVRCDYDSTTYNGFTAYLQDPENLELTFTSSTKSGSTVVVNGTKSGNNSLFVYPIWSSSEELPSNITKPVHRDIHCLTVAPTPPAPETSSSQDSMSSSSDGSVSTTARRNTPVSSGINMAAVVGGSVGGILVVIIVVIFLILVLLLLIVKKKRKMKSVSVELKDDMSFMMDEKDRRSPSAEMIAPVYETARLPPPKVVSDSVKVNGDSSVPPPSDPAPDAPGPNVADLYSVVDKSRPQEQQYESVQLIRGTKTKVEDIHKVEYATLQQQDPQPPKENNEEPPPLPARPDGTEEPMRTYVRPVDCYEVLSGMAAEWKMLAEYLGMDEDDIDEVFTNNESDVACLNDFLSRICILSTKEDMSEALEKMGLMHESKAILTLPNRKLMEGQY